jgi:hypothetical protein
MTIGLVETCQLAWQPEKPKKAQKGEKKLVVLLMGCIFIRKHLKMIS